MSVLLAITVIFIIFWKNVYLIKNSKNSKTLI